MNVAIFLDDVNDYNGPLMFIPGSHKRGVVDARHDLTTTSYPLWTIDNGLIMNASDGRSFPRSRAGRWIRKTPRLMIDL
jgi:ectoine hydroxylase